MRHHYTSHKLLTVLLKFKIGIVGGWSQLSPLGTEANNRPIVPVPVDYGDGEFGGMIGRGNQSTPTKPAPVPLCPPQNPTYCPDANPGRRYGKPATNPLSYRTAITVLFVCKIFDDVLIKSVFLISCTLR
jgi:hypothetical protein